MLQTLNKKTGIYNETRPGVPNDGTIFSQDSKRGIGLGVFDGYHRGHQELIRTLLSRTQELKMASCIYTFVNHPAVVSGNHEKISMGLLSTEEGKIDMLKRTGVDEIVCQEFSVEFSHVSALAFLEDCLLARLHAALIVVGFNYRFGCKREGDVSFLKSWAEEKHIEVIVIEPVVFAGTSISSSAIRRSINKGDFETANAMLGRDYSLTGIVRPGQGLGGKLGFPTANILPAEGMCLPENGVYITRLSIGEQTVESVTNIGLRPSVPGALTTPIVETTMLDLDADLYGKEVQVSFLHMLRKEKKFVKVEDLRLQVQNDIQTARTWHMESEQCWKLAEINKIPVYAIKTHRFTGDVISIVFKMSLANATASRNALLARMLSATCRRFPSRPALSKYLDSLYGASIDFQVEAAGDVQMISFTADALHTWRGLSYPFQDAVELLFDMIAFPDLDENGHFSKEIFLSERLNLINEIQTRENDKTKYALDKCLDFLTADTAQNTKSYGEISVLQEISLDELTKAYQELINKSGISIFVAGNIDHVLSDRIFRRTREVFKNNTESFLLIPGKTPQCYHPVPKNEIHTEKKDIEQAKVCIAYKGLDPYFSNNTATASMLNNMLGGDVHSLLFDVVREQMGLAYSVFSAPFRYLSSIVLVAGVAPEKTTIAIECMKQQVERLKNDDFDDALYQSALESISYSYRAISDDLHSMVSYYLNANTAGRNVSLQNALCFMKDLTREKIVEAANKLEISVQYTLSQLKTEEGDGQ